MTQDQTDEDIEKQLAGEALRGPRQWRGKPLAPLSKGLRDLTMKVVRPDDTGYFHDLAYLHILTSAHAETPDAKLAARRALLAATDDVAEFRARINLLFDDLTDEDIAAARALVDELLGLVDAATVQIAEKKSAASPVEPSPMTPPSLSGPPSKPRAGRKTSSAGK